MSKQSLKITSRTHENNHEIKIVELDGSLDGHTFIQFNKELAGLKDKNYNKIIINFQNLNYISSAGISIITKCRRALQNVPAMGS